MKRRDFIKTASGLLVPATILGPRVVLAQNVGLRGRAGLRGKTTAMNTASAVYDAEAANPTSGPTWLIEGFGAGTTGGAQAGRSVIHVTNLNDSGAGSLRAALTTSGPRLVVFDVSGNIDLSTEIEILDGDLTVDGGDAPNRGVCITGEPLSVRASNCIFRYLRFRRGPTADPEDVDSCRVLGAPSVSEFISGICFDHCSFSWGDDGNIDIGQRVQNITLQWCMVYENFGSGNTLIAPGGDTCSGTSGPTQWTVHHCLYAQGGRNPEVNTGQGQWINNVVYRNSSGVFLAFETLSYSIPFEGIEPQWDVVGNYYKSGSDETDNDPTNHRPVKLIFNETCSSLGNEMFVSGNIRQHHGGATSTSNIVEVDAGLSLAGGRFFSALSGEQSASDAFTSVLANAGCTLPCRDDSDARTVTQVTNGTGTWYVEGDFGSIPDTGQDLTTSC